VYIYFSHVSNPTLVLTVLDQDAHQRHKNVIILGQDEAWIRRY